MIWLGIETSNNPLSIALVQNEQLLIEENSHLKITHSVQAMATIERLLAKAQLQPSSIEAIAISEGPGSYTGVRIGVTIAKTLAWSLDVPLVGVSSLKALAANESYFSGLICPLFDARRASVYAAGFCWKEGKLQTVIEESYMLFEQLIEKIKSTGLPTLFIGKDVHIYRDKINYELGELAFIAPLHQHLPRASALIYLAQQQDFETPVHTFIPNYRRIAEAEANWIKQQKAEKSND